jgi:hypothetical protein
VVDLIEITPAHIEALEKAVQPWRSARAEYVQPKTITQPTSDKRLRAYAEACLRNGVKKLSAMGPNTGRNRELFIQASNLGKFVHHGILAMTSVERDLMGACKANGLEQEDGAPQCLKSIRSGFDKALGDPYPTIPDQVPR